MEPELSFQGTLVHYNLEHLQEHEKQYLYQMKEDKLC